MTLLKIIVSSPKFIAIKYPKKTPTSTSKTKKIKINKKNRFEKGARNPTKELNPHSNLNILFMFLLHQYNVLTLSTKTLIIKKIKHTLLPTNTNIISCA